MLDLDSARWSELQHANGSASNIPDLLRRFASEIDSVEVWKVLEELYDDLANQDGGYPAAYAAIPHIVEIAFQKGLATQSTMYPVFALITATEVSRASMSMSPPDDVAESYFSALRRVPDLFCTSTTAASWTETALRAAFAAVSCALDYPELAACLIELSDYVRAELRQQHLINDFP